MKQTDTYSTGEIMKNDETFNSQRIMENVENPSELLNNHLEQLQ